MNDKTTVQSEINYHISTRNQLKNNVMPAENYFGDRLRAEIFFIYIY